MDRLTSLERAVLNWFALHAGSEALRIQCQTASLIDREYTGVGQITRLKCALSAPAACFPTNCVPNSPLISSYLLPHGAGTDLWLKDGKISQLEIVAFGGAELPEDQFSFKLVESL